VECGGGGASAVLLWGAVRDRATLGPPGEISTRFDQGFDVVTRFRRCSFTYPTFSVKSSIHLPSIPGVLPSLMSMGRRTSHLFL
jgi:hypothetical protein